MPPTHKSHAQAPHSARGGEAAAGSKRSGAKPQPSIAEEEAATGDKSIQRYGSEAGGSEREAVLAAMRSFLGGMARRDYRAVCAGLSESNRAQLQALAKQTPNQSAVSCPALLARLLPQAVPAARKAIAGTISRVRIAHGNAFVLFRPPGGKLSYFVMKEEDGTWKATGLAPGTPLVP